MVDALTVKTIQVLLNKKDPTTSKKIANEIGMSVSSVKHNMEYTRKLIQSTGAILNSIPGKGIWLEANEKQRVELKELMNHNHDRSYSFSYRKSYILDILFQSKSNYTIQIFADDLGVSRNIIVKDLELIEKWLQYFDLKIIRVRNKGVCIEGGEFDIRQAIMYSNSVKMEDIHVKDDKPAETDYRIDQRFYSYYQMVYNKMNLFEVQELLQKVEQDIDFTYDDVSFVQLIEYITVSIIRVKAKNIILEKNILNNCKITNQDYTAAKNLFDTAVKDIQAYLSIEIRCMAAQFVLHGSYDAATSVIKEQYYDEIARKFVERLRNIIANKSLLVNEGLISDIGLFFQKKKMQQSYQMITGNYFRQDIKKELPSLYGIVLANIQPIENKLNVKFTENDIAYFVMLIDNAMEDTIYDLKTLLITSYDYNTSKYLENKIKRSIDNIQICKVINSEDIDTIHVEDYDLIITTTPVTIENALKISRRVGNADFDLITKKVQSIQKIKQEIIVKNYHLFDEKLIISNFAAKNKSEVIKVGCDLLMRHGFVLKGFEEKLKQRENITPTSIGNGVAIPHGYRSYVKKSGVAVIQLEHPIEWTKEDRVEIVFLIAIDFETQNEIYSFFSQFYELIDKEESIQKIKQAKTVSEILDVIEDSGIIIREV